MKLLEKLEEYEKCALLLKIFANMNFAKDYPFPK
jgi:hypothetical protein